MKIVEVEQWFAQNGYNFARDRHMIAVAFIQAMQGRVVALHITRASGVSTTR